MPATARIIQDSTSPDGTRLTTFVLRYARLCHSELLTHRVFSRNSSSSRAIPVEKMIAWVKADPVLPVEWGQNQKGMQAGAPLSSEDAAEAEKIWLEARDDAIKHTERLLELGVHKQISNRILEPWHYIAVVLTATQFANWFGLRVHKAAQPEIRQLAALMLECYRASVPRNLKPGEWHLPFVKDEEVATHDDQTLIKASVARCARVSYMNHDGTSPSIEKDIALHDMLAVSTPLHASPCEHQATPLRPDESAAKFSGNLIKGWKQYRKTLPNECIEALPTVGIP
jgi:thymidylate synthase ThyX